LPAAFFHFRHYAAIISLSLPFFTLALILRCSDYFIIAIDIAFHISPLPLLFILISSIFSADISFAFISSPPLSYHAAAMISPLLLIRC